MGPQHVPALIQKGAGGVVPARVVLEKGGVVPVGDKADVLAVPLPGADQPLLLGDVPDLLLGQPPQGEAHPCELRLGERPEDIALVLLRVEGLFQQEAAGALVPLHLGVVAGGQKGIAQLVRLLQKGAEFDGPVAHHTGVGGAARLILRRKGVHDTLGKAVRQVQGVVGNAQLGGHRPGVLRILKGVAGFSPARGQVLRLKQAQGDAGGLPALLPEQPGGHGAVHSAAHGYGNGVVQRGSSFPARPNAIN